MPLFDEPSRGPLPQPGLEDVRYAASKSLASLIPGLGGFGAELIGLLSSPVAERRDAWLEDLQRRLYDLEQKVNGFQFKDLSGNQQFVSATLQATQTAVRTHQPEKLIALRNAVLNVAAGSAPDEDLQGIFLNLIDAFTPLHLRLLRQFSLQQLIPIVDAPEWLKANICSQVAKELLDRGLLGPLNRVVVPNRNQLIVGEKGFYTFRAGLTPLGDQFLSFISEPKMKK